MSDLRLWSNLTRSANSSPKLDFVQSQTRFGFRVPLVVPVALVAGVLAFQGYQFWMPKEAAAVAAKPRMITRPAESVSDLAVAPVASAPVAAAEENNEAPHAAENLALDKPEQVVEPAAANMPLAQEEARVEIKVPSRQTPSPRAIAPRVSPAVIHARAAPASLPKRKPVAHQLDTDSATLSAAPKENVELQNQVQLRLQQPVAIPEVTFKRHVRLMHDMSDSDAAASDSGR